LNPTYGYADRVDFPGVWRGTSQQEVKGNKETNEEKKPKSYSSPNTWTLDTIAIKSVKPFRAGGTKDILVSMST